MLLATTIATDRDDHVRIYAAMASKNLINDSELLTERMIGVVADPHEHIDIRHNALDAVMALWDLPRRKAVLESFLTDPEPGKHAARELAKYHSDCE